MDSFTIISNIMPVFFIVVFVIVLGGMILIIASMFSPKLQAWMMGRRIKATKHLMNDSKDDMKDIGNNVSDLGTSFVDHSVKNANKLVSDNKEELGNLGKNVADIKASVANQSLKNVGVILNDNEESLNALAGSISTATAPVVQTVVQAINSTKEEQVLSNKKMVYCKHCGKQIDENSTFCKYCGKSQE